MMLSLMLAGCQSQRAPLPTVKPSYSYIEPERNVSSSPKATVAHLNADSDTTH